MNLPLNEWLYTPFNIRLFILRWMCERDMCGQPITLDTCNELLKSFSYSHHQNYTLSEAFNDKDSTFFDNAIKLEGYLIAWDGENPIDMAWHHAVKSIKRQLATPTMHEFIS